MSGNDSATDPIHDYLTYVRDVLGAKQVLIGRPRDPASSLVKEMARTRTGHWPPPARTDLLILQHGEGLFEGPAAELWEKMKAAMKLGTTQILELETLPDRDDLDGVLLEALAVYPANFVLLMSSAPARGDFRVLNGAKVIETFAAPILVEAPELKRGAWEDLQTLMRGLHPENPNKKN